VGTPRGLLLRSDQADYLNDKRGCAACQREIRLAAETLVVCRLQRRKVQATHVPGQEGLPAGSTLPSHAPKISRPAAPHLTPFNTTSQRRVVNESVVR
jgi:hypothetical protein